jgi:hypothetical protein
MTTNVSANPWLAVVLRVTAFPRAPEDMGKDLGWEALVGEAPESVEEQPRVKATISKGQFLNGELIHTRYVDRVELVYSARLDESVVASGGFLVIGPAELALSDCQPLMINWLDGLPGIQRLAFGAVLRMPVSSHNEAYQRLNGLLSSVNVPSGSSDFLYQINRPRASDVKHDLLINRLMKWSAIRATSIVTGAKAGVVTNEKFGCQLELDVNTHQEFQGEFTKSEIHGLFEELVKFAFEIQEKGESA